MLNFDVRASNFQRLAGVRHRLRFPSEPTHTTRRHL
jgi:hypothetical protein